MRRLKNWVHIVSETLHTALQTIEQVSWYVCNYRELYREAYKLYPQCNIVASKFDSVAKPRFNLISLNLTPLIKHGSLWPYANCIFFHA